MRRFATAFCCIEEACRRSLHIVHHHILTCGLLARLCGFLQSTALAGHLRGLGARLREGSIADEAQQPMSNRTMSRTFRNSSGGFRRAYLLACIDSGSSGLSPSASFPLTQTITIKIRYYLLQQL